MPSEENLNINQIIHNISFQPKNRLGLFLEIPIERRREIILRLTRHIQHEIITSLPEEELIKTLEGLDPDEATDIIQLLPGHRQKKIVNKLNKELREGVEILSKFDPQTAAGLMNVDYIEVEIDDTVTEVAKQFKLHEKRTGRLPAIIAVDKGKVAGYVPGHELGFSKPTEKIRKYVRRISTIKHNADHDEVVRVFRERPHNKVVVVGDKNNIIGIIYSDDILNVLNKREASSLYEFAGVHDEESVSDTVATKVKFRYQWLILNLFTAFLAASVVGIFEETISKVVLLAAFMPVVAGMGGNAGTQTLAILVRGISQRQIELKNLWSALKRELGTAIVNGLIVGAIASVSVYLFTGNKLIALILATAMIVNLIVASFFGTLVPLVMKRLGRDPATSATIFITTATDVIGFLVFLGLATLLLT